MHLSLKRIATATLIAPLASTPISIIFWNFVGIPKDLYGDAYYITYIMISAISAIVSYAGLLIFGTLPMLIRRKTDDLNIRINSVALAYWC